MESEPLKEAEATQSADNESGGKMGYLVSVTPCCDCLCVSEDMILSSDNDYPNLNVLLLHVSHHIVGDWRVLAWQLGISPEIIEAAESNNPHDIVARAAEVLSHWKKMKGDSATWAEIKHALVNIQREDIVKGEP